MARLSRVEAVLFLAKEALPARRLGQLANLADGTEARTLVQELSRKYHQWGSAIEVEQVAEGYRLLVRPQFAPWLRQLTSEENDWKLSPPALDTLTVVAYRQPVLRSEVEAIRGVSSGELLRQLIERDLLRIVGRSRELGRPLLYGTTKRFLQTFGLRSLDDLPLASELRREANGTSPARGDTLTATSLKAA
jgi:segregation and condensation protein B